MIFLKLHHDIKMDTTCTHVDVAELCGFAAASCCGRPAKECRASPKTNSSSDQFNIACIPSFGTIRSFGWHWKWQQERSRNTKSQQMVKYIIAKDFDYKVVAINQQHTLSDTPISNNICFEHTISMHLHKLQMKQVIFCALKWNERGRPKT